MTLQPETGTPATPTTPSVPDAAAGPTAPTTTASATPDAPAAPDAPDAPAHATEHTYAADELFFSTTDARGRIRRANSTFMRLSGFPRGALVGRAHNVVRHPDMPAGLFHSVWQDIEAGKAASAYITNRSADGGSYRVFATIVPSKDGYLSVRTLPMRTELRDQVEAAYSRVLEVEAASTAAGSTRREVAAAGQAALKAELEALGYRDSIDFTRQALPEEISALVASGVDIPEREGDGPVARILAEMNAIEDSTSGLVSQIDECSRLVSLLGTRAAEIGALSKRLGSLREALRTLVADAGRLGDSAAADVVASRYQEVDTLVLECFEQLHPLAGQVAELRGDVDSVRFGIALLRLHNLAAGFFAVQLLAGQDALEENDAVGSLEELVAALSEGAHSLADRLELFRARAELVGGELDVVAKDLTQTHQPLMDLLGAAADAGAADEASARAARSLVRDGFPEARDLADLAGAVRDLEVPYKAAEIEAHLGQLRAALAEVE
ncbi:Aerotaxis receptor [Actinomyces bovis]|uniref:Aerotaxis receptor n=1 Tax=Actinomyces bovis TaxID=1658 RepID=A0ABY1VNH3_9ACTO|nr:PAS domain-containing protein [Actinomyces bovis]SPT53654.1 Aerotaxis receptor [Actinomyces bovis]VEG55738.1 Aerotaxis receptor [Actinomyces israelii]